VLDSRPRELHVALRAGWHRAPRPARDNKSAAELARAIEVGGGIIVDSSRDRPAAGAERRGPHPKVLVRVTRGGGTHPRVRAHRHEERSSGSRSPQGRVAAVEELPRSRVDLAGIHAHIGSQVFDVSCSSRLPRSSALLLRSVSTSCAWRRPRVVRERESAPSQPNGRGRAAACRAEGVAPTTRITASRAARSGGRGDHPLSVGTVKALTDLRTYVRSSADERQPAARALRQRLRGFLPGGQRRAPLGVRVVASTARPATSSC